MHRAIALVVLIVVLGGVRNTAKARTYVTAGVGLGEILHAEFGGFVAPRTTLDASWGWVIFNHLVGFGATQYFALGTSDGFPKHALLASGRLRLNPTLGEPRLVGSGDTIAATAEAYGGYAYTAKSGFTARASVGVLVFQMGNELQAGPNVLVSLGWTF